MNWIRRAATGAILTAIVLSPWLEGALAARDWPLLLLPLAALAVAALGGRPGWTRWRGIGLCIVSTTLTVTAVDLALRVLLAETLAVPPYALNLSRWPRMPLVRRYPPHFHWKGKLYGNLGAGREAAPYREYRQVEMLTDAYGFRNSPAAEPGHPLDVIALGDSFGEGIGTTQDATWVSLLSRHHGLRCYNLSISGNSPWQEYTDLSMMPGTPPVRRETTVLWAIYAGNDLDDQDYYPCWDAGCLPWKDFTGQALVALDDYRHQSPVYQVSERLKKALDQHPGLNDPQSVGGNPVRELPRKGMLIFHRKETEQSFRRYEEVRHHAHFPALCRTVEAMKQLTDRRGLRLLMVLIPTSGEVYSWLLQGGKPWSASREPSGLSHALSEVCRKNGIRFVDSLPVLIDESQREYQRSGKLLWWRDDSHFNLEGHKVFAAFAAQCLRESAPGN